VTKKDLECFFKEDKDWQNVLNYWAHSYRTGLTIHALATLCDRPPAEILKEMRADGHTGIQICHTICAPVFSWSRFRKIQCNYYGTTTTGPLTVRLGFNNTHASALAEVLLERWPWPKYKGIKNWQGITRIDERIPRGMIAKLRKAVKGEIV